MHASVSKACVSSSSLHSVLIGVRCARRAYHVWPISSLRFAASTLKYRVLPTTSPVLTSRTMNGIAPLRSRMSSAVSSQPSVRAGDGTDVYQRRHSAPSAAAARTASRCDGASGSSDACAPRSVTGSMKRSPTSCASHEHDAFEQVHVLFVLEQGAVQRRYHGLAIGAVQRLRRDVFCEQELQPVEQLRRRRLLLESRHVAQVEEHLEGLLQQRLLEPGKVHVDDARHRLAVGEPDVMEETASKKSVRQLLLVVRRDDDERPVPRDDRLLRFVD